MTNDTDINERLEIKDLVSESEDNMRGAKLLIDNFKHIKWHTMWDFWDELAKKLEECSFKIISRPKIGDITNTTHYDSYKVNYNKNNDYGMRFKVGRLSDIELFIWNNKDNKLWIHWGIDRDKLSSENQRKFDEYLKNNPTFFEEVDECYWKYFELEVQEQVRPSDFEHQGTFNLIKEQNCEEIIQKMVSEINDFIEKMKNSSLLS